MYSDIAQEISSVAGLPSEQISEVVRILENYLAELEQGGRPAPEALLARHPEHARLLQIYLEKLELLHAAGAGLRGTTWSHAASVPGPVSQPSRLGDYRILREVGRGGMGVVYEAVQESLGRRVALKVLPSAAALDPRQRQRFKHEAQAAAQLHHPNIVPVFGVGDEDGVHYYAMQFVDGQTLAGLIQQMRQRTRPVGPAAAGSAAASSDSASTPSYPPPTECRPAGEGPTADYPFCPPAPVPAAAGPGWPESGPTAHPATWPAYLQMLARLGIQAAEALEHAHQLGVIHRDVKPANLLVDSRGSVWVTDFGLAQFRAGAELTQSGDLVGTLRYMSPEQALAKRGLVDQRTDIYSLGLTLYEAATLGPAFTGRDREELLRQIAFEEPRPPRRLNPAIPGDLETILLKATAKEPAARYATAQELADDLRRFLNDEPIRARRPTLVQRAVKAGRRHRAVLTATIIVALLGLSASTLLFWRDQAQTEAQRAQTEAQRVQTAEQRELARDAADAMYGQLQKWLAHEPWVEDEQRDFLMKALRFYEVFAREPGTTAGTRYKAVEATHRVAEIHYWLAKWPPGAPALEQLKVAEGPARQAVALLEQLVADCPEDFLSQQALANCYMTLGQVLEGRRLLEPGRTAADAEQAFRHAGERLDKLAANFPAQRDYRDRLGQCHDRLGHLLAAAGRGPQAEEAYRKAEAIFAGLAQEAPKEPNYGYHLAEVYMSRGGLFGQVRRFRDAEEFYRKAVATWERFLQSDPRSPPDFRDELGQAYQGLGTVLEQAAAGEAEQARQQLLVRCALVGSPLPLAAGCWGLREAGARYRLQEAEEFYEKGRAVFQKLVDTFPQVPRYQGWLGRTLDSLALVHGRRGDLAGARELVQRAIRHQRAALSASPGSINYGVDLQQEYGRLGTILLELRNHDQAARAAEDLSQVISRCPVGGWMAVDLLARCVPVAERDRQLSPAERQRRAGTYTAKAWALAHQVAENCAWLPMIQNNVAWFLVACPDPHYRDPSLAVKLASEALRAEPQNASYWNTLGLAQYRKGECKAATAALRKAIELDRGSESLDWLILAMAQWRVGEKQPARASFARALQSNGTAAEEEVSRFRAEAAALLGLPPRTGTSEAYPPHADSARGHAAPPGGAG